MQQHKLYDIKQQPTHFCSQIVESASSIYKIKRTYKSKRCSRVSQKTNKDVKTQKLHSCKLCKMGENGWPCLHTIQQWYQQQRSIRQECISVSMMRNDGKSYENNQKQQKNTQQYKIQPPIITKSNKNTTPPSTKNKNKQNWMGIRVPQIYQFTSGQLPRHLLDTISTFNTKINGNTNKLYVDLIRTNSYKKIGPMSWFVYHVSQQQQCCAFQVLSLNPHSQQLQVINSKYFVNMLEYQNYFNINSKELNAIIGKTNTNNNDRYAILGIFHTEYQTNDNNKQFGVIDSLYLQQLNDFNTDTKMVLLNPFKLNNLNDNKKQQGKQQIKTLKQNLMRNINEVAGLDMLNEKLQTYHNQKQAIQYTCQPQLQLQWESAIDLQYKLKKLLFRLTYCPQPIQKNQISQHHKIEDKQNIQQLRYKGHYIIRLAINEQTNYFMVVYNHETIVQDKIQQYSQKVDKVEKRENNRLQQFQTFQIQRQLQWLLQHHKLKYSNQYYIQFFKKYTQFDMSLTKFGQQTQQKLCCTQCFNFIAAGKIMQINKYQKMKICKYTLIQNIDSQQLFTDKMNCSQIYHNFLRILQLPEYLLKSNPVNNKIIIYWILGLCGKNVSKIYNQIQNRLSDFTIRFTQIKNEQNISQKMSEYFKDNELFKQQDHAFLILNKQFNLSSLQQIIQQVSQNSIHTIHTQIYLITPQLNDVTIFCSQINGGKSIQNCPIYCQNNQYPQLNRQQIGLQLKQLKHEMKASYYFPIDFILCSILDMQRDTENMEFNGKHVRSIEGLAEMVHYFSSTYYNLDIIKTIHNCNIYQGDIKIIEYDSKQRMRIKWENITEYEKQQVYDQLRLLLELSYKCVLQEDTLLAYFLQNLDNLEYQYCVDGIGDHIVDSTFQNLPYYIFNNKDKQSMIQQ